MGDSTVYLQSKWQATTSPSTLESEYVAMSEAMKHGLHHQCFAQELGHKFEEILLNCDNMGAISLVNNLSFYLKIKHIDICIHMIHGYVSLSYI